MYNRETEKTILELQHEECVGHLQAILNAVQKNVNALSGVIDKSVEELRKPTQIMREAVQFASAYDDCVKKGAFDETLKAAKALDEKIERRFTPYEKAYKGLLDDYFEYAVKVLPCYLCANPNKIGFSALKKSLQNQSISLKKGLAESKQSSWLKGEGSMQSVKESARLLDITEKVSQVTNKAENMFEKFGDQLYAVRCAKQEHKVAFEKLSKTCKDLSK